MGIIYDMLSSMSDDSLGDIAMEADDITNEVKQGASDMGGEGGGNSGSNDIDLDTDNIFAKGDPTQSKSNGSNGDANSDNSNESPEDTGNDDESSSEPDEGGDSEDPENAEGDEGDELDSMDSESNDAEQDSDSPDALQKKRVKKQMLHLYDTIEDDIKLLSETMPDITTAETSIALGNIKKNLVQCNGYIHEILKDEYASLDYPILKKKFIALSNVYDLCVRSIDIYFKKNGAKKKDDN